ncbi:hypothetical protein C2G38_2046622 [Gigaspora rosea]|uniref:Uncharacterized protein n=1 Tax=Gigaspora rosea TaxID=44941 RepID=A0A397U8N9_9GLOM|nr:hypothetical protein C2G38_2046622 [Gigaspora rosea]
MSVSKERKAPCSVGSCTGTGDEKTYNAYKIARPEGVKVDRISLGPTFKNDQFYFNDTLYKCVWSRRLLQGDRPRFKKLVLSDITIHLTFTSVHPGQLGNLVGLAPWGRMMTPFRPNGEEEEDRVPNGEEVAQMVMEQFQVPVSGEISCKNTGCLLKESNFYMCYKFDKNEQNVCLHTEVEGEATVSDTANFAFIIVVDYMPGFYKIRRLRATLPGEDNRRLTNQASYFLGSEFSFAGGQTGLPVFISDGSIEIAYQYNASIENTFALARVIAQELRGGGNDNAMDQD